MKQKPAKQRYCSVVQMITGRMEVLNIFPEELAQKALHREAGAVRRRLADPDRMPLGDYLRICRALDIPIEDVRAAIDYKALAR